MEKEKSNFKRILEEYKVHTVQNCTEMNLHKYGEQIEGLKEYVDACSGGEHG